MTLVVLFIVALLHSFEVSLQSSDTYSAVVVEFHPVSNSSLDSDDNIANNVANFVSVIQTASSEYSADIIVFPESALTGFVQGKKTFFVPDPTDVVQLCNSTSEWDSLLITLACASADASAYVVVNLIEKYYNSTLQSLVYFNTDVVFDPRGAVIARYRKINLYGEGSLSPSPDGQLSYFDTDFGVRFGLLTCFDIIFKSPGVVLARDYNISHFIFPTRWFSQMPFLTAIQEQYYWAYTLDVVLLASEYNLPSIGNTGSGIYLGRQGPATYNMTSLVGTFLLHADVPKQYPYLGNTSLARSSELAKHPNIQLQNGDTRTLVQSSPTSDTIYFKKDYLEVYSTEIIETLDLTLLTFNESDFTSQTIVEKQLCQNSLCCSFSLNITLSFSTTRPNISRGDDYSQLYYRLAVFDGVKNYDGAATGGLQTCAIIPCPNTSLSSCGLRSDSTFAEPNHLSGFYQTEFVFESIQILANISNNNSFVGPNVLLQGQDGNNFGELLDPDSFVFNETYANGTIYQTFQTLKATKIVTASLYGRLFTRDGEAYTGSSSMGNSLSNVCLNKLLLIFSVVFFQLRH